MHTTTPQKIKIGDRATIPLFSYPVQAGFPSPAEDKIERKLNLHQLLISHPASTFFVTVEGDSMLNEDKSNGIFEEDILIVDKSLDPKSGDIVIAHIDGEFTVKTFGKINGRFYLLPSNSKYPPIPVLENTEVWGVVTYIIHKA